MPVLTKEHPINFSSDMVRAILEGRKTTTRQPIKPQPQVIENRGGSLLWGWPSADNWRVAGWGQMSLLDTYCPLGQPGDRLWVRESFIYVPASYCYEASVSIPHEPEHYVYRADEKDPRGGQWSPSVHMPRSASRITLEIVGVGIEKLHGIDDYGALAEGVEGWVYDPRCETPRDGFRVLWDSLHAKKGFGWETNPFVWVIGFKRVEE